MHLIRNLAELGRLSNQFKNPSLEPYSLKPIHAFYLQYISEFPGISQDGLAKRMLIDKSNIARQTAFLEEEGFVLRCSSEADKRVIQLFLTEKGASLLPAIRERDEKWMASITADFTTEEKETLACLLQKARISAAKMLGGCPRA